MENLVKVATSISESCCNMLRYLDGIDPENASETHQFIDKFSSLIFGSHDQKGWIFSCNSQEDSDNLYRLLSIHGPLFKRAFKQAGNKQKEFQIPLDKLPMWIKKKITNCTDTSQLGQVFRNHLLTPKNTRFSSSINTSSSLRYDLLEYFLWRFLFSPILIHHQSVSLGSGELYLQLFVEYCDFFLSSSNSPFTASDFYLGKEGKKNTRSTFYALKNNSLAFEAIHIKDYSKFVQSMEYFFISFIDEFWLISPSALYSNWTENGSKDSLLCNVVPSEILLACMNEFLNFTSENLQDNSTVKSAITTLKPNLFSFLDSILKSPLPIESEYLASCCWISLMKILPILNSSFLESDFAIYYLLLGSFVEYIATKSTLVSCSNWENVRKEVKLILIPILNFYSSNDLLPTLSLYEQLLVDGERNKFESKGFSHAKYQALKLALSDYEWKGKITEVSFLNVNSASSNPILIAALLQRSIHFVDSNGRLERKGEFQDLLSKSLQLVCNIFGLEEEKISWQQILQQSRPSTSSETASSSKRPLKQQHRKFNVVSDESMAVWSKKQFQSNPARLNEVKVAVYLFAAISFILNWTTSKLINLARSAVGRELKFLDRLPTWNLRRFAAWQWLITIPVWYLLLRLFFYSGWKGKAVILSCFLLFSLVHRIWLRNRVIFL